MWRGGGRVSRENGKQEKWMKKRKTTSAPKK